MEIRDCVKGLCYPVYCLFNIYFDTVRFVSVERFSKDPGISVALVYLQTQQTKGWPGDGTGIRAPEGVGDA